jgi:hypothetical protein
MYLEDTGRIIQFCLGMCLALGAQLVDANEGNRYIYLSKRLLMTYIIHAGCGISTSVLSYYYLGSRSTKTLQTNNHIRARKKVSKKFVIRV